MKYTVTKAVQLPTGTLVRIGKEKAARHAAQLAHIKGNQYECLSPVWVKAGEVVDLDAGMPKHLLGCLDAHDKKRAAPAATDAQAVPAAPAAPDAEGADEDSANAAPVETDPAAGE